MARALDGEVTKFLAEALAGAYRQLVVTVLTGFNTGTTARVYRPVATAATMARRAPRRRYSGGRHTAPRSSTR